MFKKILGGIFVLLVFAVFGVWMLWPDDLAVKGPVWDFLTGKQIAAPSDEQLSHRLKVPEGFRIGIFAENVPHARMMRTTKRGDVIVSSIREGNVILLHADDNGDGASDGRSILLSGLDSPHGLALKGGFLYVAETHQIIRAKFNAETRTIEESELVFGGLPPGGNHRTRTIGFGPDGLLYVTIGSSCNVCIEDHPYRAAMLRMEPDGTDMMIYATGLRNTVGFDWNPKTGKLYGTDNGRDLLGDDIPHCELNQIEQGKFYGWPLTFDNKAVDPDYGTGKEAEILASEEMVLGLGAHVAPLGIKFLDPLQTPPGYEGAALVALHGSWNRSILSGYKVVSIHYNDDGPLRQQDFLGGFEKDEDVIGRPVDIVQGLDGAIYISDDYSGTIYRIGWGDIVVASPIENSKQMNDPLTSLSEIERAAFIAEGADLYSANECAACHDPLMAPLGVQVKRLSNLKERYDIEALAKLLEVPPGPMPRPDITREERKALAVYLLSKE